ncbi:response regulator [Pelomonas sp. P8]|uniref:Response regulator n=2 Tax=Pelomonas cellulosilytica TaxID=2906762 RepID=A0ABS8XMN8_9BURK|nr:response regulator [Pelomonas sp. P8]
MLLELCGARVTSASNGLHALQRLDDDGLPDVLISDITMPGLDGYRLVEALRGRPGGASPVAVALSGLARPQDDERARQAGFDQLVCKPALVEDIEGAVEAVLRRRG